MGITNKFKPGDVVKLKSDFYGHYLMTVDHQDDNYIYCHCVWFDDMGIFQEGIFNEDVLEIVKKPAGV